MLFFVLIATTVCCWGQVGIDRPVVLIASDDAQRQVLGLPPLMNSAAAASAAVEQSGGHRYASAGTGTTWQLAIPALSAGPTPGTQIVVEVTDTTGAGPLQLLLNGSGPFDVVRSPGVPLLAEEISPIPLLSLVFDGTAFQVMNGKVAKRRECPAGTVGVSEQFCIEVADRDTLDFIEASSLCAGLNMRLCTWGEWYSAAQIGTTLGMSGITGNWEWTDDACNENMAVRITGLNSAMHTGCANLLSPARNFRCCFTR